MELTRTVRVALVPARGSLPRVAAWGTHGAWQAAMEFEVRVAGDPDATTGYLVGIDRIDACTRQALEQIGRASCRERVYLCV